MKFQQWEPDLLTLVSRIDGDEIDLQPDFQRHEVWATPKQRKLIDTILRNWSMPPIHLVEAKSGVLEVLDGQQRLVAIRDFVHGRIRVDGKVEPNSSDIQSLHGLRYANLPPEVKRAFDRYTVRAFRISDFSPEEPSELFYRLNMPTLLTAGEKRNSLYGESRSQLKNLIDLFITGNDQEDIGFSNARLAYDDVVARLLYFLHIGNFNTKVNEGSISDTFRRKSGFDPYVVDRAEKSIRSFTEARKAVGRVKLNKASLLSWFIFFARGQDSSRKLEFLGQFSGDPRGGPFLMQWARALFNDRASGRVTNVSSVFLRDICLWLSFVDAHNAYDLAPSQYAYDAMKEVTAQFEVDHAHDEHNLEEIIADKVVIELWSELR